MSVNLTKGQKISLNKESGSQLTHVTMGLGWEPITKKGFFGGKKKISVDLDASCLLFDDNKELIDNVWFSQLKSHCGSIIHTGDNVTGEGDGDDEQIKVNLNALSPKVSALIFTINSFSGESFDMIQEAYCRLVDQSTNKEIAKFNLTETGSYTAMVMCKLYRHNGEWKMAAIGEPSNGRVFRDMMGEILPFV